MNREASWAAGHMVFQEALLLLRQHPWQQNPFSVRGVCDLLFLRVVD